MLTALVANLARFRDAHAESVRVEEHARVLTHIVHVPKLAVNCDATLLDCHTTRHVVVSARIVVAQFVCTAKPRPLHCPLAIRQLRWQCHGRLARARCLPVRVATERVSRAGPASHFVARVMLYVLVKHCGVVRLLGGRPRNPDETAGMIVSWPLDVNRVAALDLDVRCHGARL